MGRKNHRCAGFGNFAQLFDEDGALGHQALDHGAVMHNLVPDINRRAELLYGKLDDLNSPVDPGAKSPRSREEHVKVWFNRHKGCLQRR